MRWIVWLGLLATGAGCAPAADGPALDLEAVRTQFARDGHFDDSSVTILRQLHSAGPEDRSVGILLEQALLEREDWNALVELVREREGDPLELATVLLKAQRFDEAAECLATSDARTSTDARRVWMAVYADFHRGRYGEAAALLDARLDDLVAGGYPDALLLRGTIALQADDLERARDLLERFLELQPTHPAGHDALGRTLSALGDEPAAREHLQRAQALHAELSRVETARARLSAQATAVNAAFASGDHATCERLLNEMLPAADAALRVELYRYLARVHAAQGRAEQAEQALDQARRLELERR